MISKWLENSVAWLEKLVAFDTRNGTGDEVACAQFLKDALAKHNPDNLVFETVPRSRDKSESAYVLATWGTPKALLNVHIDTVPSGEGWLTDPHVLRQEGERYVGLGASDIKGAAACILAALEDIQPKDVAILFSGDEEHGSEVMPAVIKAGHYGHAPMAIVCEPTGCRVGRRHRGMLAFSAMFTGKGGHSSLADITETPLQDAARLATALGDYGRVHKDFGDDPYKGLCLNIGDIENDGAYNVIPTRSKLWFSMRPPPGDDVQTRRQEALAIGKTLFPETSIDTIVAFPSFATYDIAAFQTIFGDFDPVDLPYWTEAAMLSDAGVNTVVYGPGDVDQAHKPNEYVTGAHLEEATALYAKVLAGQYL